MFLLSDTLFWFQANKYFLFLLNAACLLEKQQIPIILSLAWLTGAVMFQLILLYRSQMMHTIFNLCSWFSGVNPNSEDIQFSKLVSTNTKEIQEEENQNAASLKMNTSISSPSITDYIRNHLDSFSSRIPHNFLDPISLIQSKPTPIKSPSPIIDSSSKGEIITGDIELSSIVSQMTEWKPQYGSPRVTSGMHDRVSFSLEADEDDLEGLLSVETKIDDVSLELENHPPQIHHFCSFIQKNTTMPNLQCVSCNW